MIVDEFHYIKNSQAQRTKSVKMIAKKIPSVLLLSGTPLLSRPVELFNGLQLMDPLTWNNWWKFTIRYCQGHKTYFGWDCSGASNIEELQNRISHYFLRRRKEDVLPELPPKRFIDLAVELDEEKRAEYQLAYNDLVDYLREIKDKNDEEITKSMKAKQLVKLGALRQITTQGKIKSAEEIIKDIVEGGEKIVIFSCYNEPLEYLKEKFGDSAVLLTGKTPEKERKKIIEDFQNNSKIKIFLGGIKSAGVGITLTAASSVLFIDYSWVPSDHSQATDRLHRIGQIAESIAVYQLYSKNTIDEYMKNILGEKQIIFDKLIEDPTISTQASPSLVNNLINTIKNETKTKTIR